MRVEDLEGVAQLCDGGGQGNGPTPDLPLRLFASANFLKAIGAKREYTSCRIVAP
jgi:hypothetical protein